MYLVDQHSMRKIAGRTGIPYSTVYDNITLVKAKGLTWSQLETMNEEALECMLSTNDKQRPLPDLAYVEKELKREESPFTSFGWNTKKLILMVISIVVFAKCMKTGVKRMMSIHPCHIKRAKNYL